MKKILTLGAALVAAVVLTFAVGTTHKTASAQGVLYDKTGNTAVGLFVPVFNTTDSLLFDGELVMADTTAATSSNIRRIGVLRYNGGALNKARVLGIVAGNIASHANKGTGRILIWGYHPAAYIDVSNLAANRPIKLGATVGCFSANDSLAATVGYAISRTSAATSTVNTGPRYRYKVYFFGQKINGAAL